MKNAIYTNKSELFKQAHKVARVVVSFNPTANYRTVFGQALKAITLAFSSAKEMKLKAELYINAKLPAQFQKSLETITTKVSALGKYDIDCAANTVINALPENQAKAIEVSNGAAAYYEKVGAVTMC